MKQIKLFGILFFIGLISFTSCESVEEAQKTADKFYEAFNNTDEKAMDKILDQVSVIDAGIKGDFYDVFDKHASAFGKVINYDRYAFSTNLKNGQSIVSLKYKCETEEGTIVYEKLKLIKRDDSYKVFAYLYNIDKAVIDKDE